MPLRSRVSEMILQHEDLILTHTILWRYTYENPPEQAL
jgi:hypothetical protein